MDVLATAVVAAAKKLNVQIPIILRLEGTNVEEGRKILADSGLKFEVGTTMKEAAELGRQSGEREVVELRMGPTARRRPGSALRDLGADVKGSPRVTEPLHGI